MIYLTDRRSLTPMSTAPESRFRWLVEHAIAVSAIPFVFFAFEKFLPSTSGLVESKVAAAGALFIAWIKSF
jgi:hypothetical protein